MPQFMGSQRVGHDLVTKQQQENKYILENSLPGGSDGKESAWNMYMVVVQSLPEKGMATHSHILAWTIPWTEEPGKESDTTE